MNFPGQSDSCCCGRREINNAAEQTPECLLGCFLDPGSGGGTAPSPLWRPDGTVYAIEKKGNTLYIGGSFTRIGPSTGYGVPVDSTSGSLAYGIKDILPVDNITAAGSIKAAVADGAGGWYIGGAFDRVGSATRNNIARINADGSLHPWKKTAAMSSQGESSPSPVHRRSTTWWFVI